MGAEPETFYLEPNQFCPNNEYPVLVYRNCLPLPLSEEKTTEFLESHAWVKKGTWGHISVRHFHPNTRECYGIFQGESTMLVGCGSSDTSGGQEIQLRPGDVIILPAGTGHCNTESSENYMYVGLYPEGAPQYRYDLGNEDSDMNALRNEVNAVVMPAEDPVDGSAGRLFDFWKN